LLEARQSHYAGFSAVHINAFVRQVIGHWASSIAAPFDFMEAAHILDPAPDISHHLVRFLRLCAQLNVPRPEIVDFLSTAFVSNAYPPGMYSGTSDQVLFDPRWLFHARYYDACSLASQSADVAGLIPAVREAFVRLVQSHQDPLHLRRTFLLSTWSRWSSMKDNNICLSCVERPPENSLRCDHSICDTCVLRYGLASPGAEYHFRLDDCIMCQAKNELYIRIKPPTAGKRLMCIDGGGTRAAIALESLCLLQELLPDLPPQELFDLTLGTSSGKLK
jgi:hypothetical protein